MDQAALLLPDVERRIADPHLPADLFNPRPKLSLLQRKRDLPLRKLAPLHVMIPFLSKGKNHAGNSTFKWYELLEQRQRGLLRNSPLTSIKKRCCTVQHLFNFRNSSNRRTTFCFVTNHLTGNISALPSPGSTPLLQIGQ